MLQEHLQHRLRLLVKLVEHPQLGLAELTLNGVIRARRPFRLDAQDGAHVDGEVSHLAVRALGMDLDADPKSTIIRHSGIGSTEHQQMASVTSMVTRFPRASSDPL